MTGVSFEQFAAVSSVLVGDGGRGGVVGVGVGVGRGRGLGIVVVVIIILVVKIVIVEKLAPTKGGGEDSARRQ